MLGQRLEAQARAAREGMVRAHQDHPIPVIAGQHDQIVKQLQRFGCDGEINLPIRGHLGDLRRRALMQMQGDAWKARSKSLDDRGQGITGLRVRGRNGQITRVRLPEFLGNILDVIDLKQEPAGVLEDPLPGRRDLGEVFAIAHKDAHAQFLF